MARVFTNLLNNSLQAIGSRPGGFVRIALVREGKNILASVADNGSGIPAGTNDRIFQPNFTTKSGGMGLGLAIVQSILTGAGASITFISEPGNGTTFTITFPSIESA